MNQTSKGNKKFIKQEKNFFSKFLMIWAIVQLSTKETQFFCVMKVIDGGVLPEFLIEEFGSVQL